MKNNDVLPPSISETQNEDTIFAIDKLAGIEAQLAPKPKNKLALFEHLRITEKTQIPAPVSIIKINDELISTEGNLTTISGASKSGKSAFTSILLAGAISQDGIIDGLPGVEVVPNREGFAVIHIDTEQARHKQQGNLKAILRRAHLETCPDYFLSYNIRQLDISEYADITARIFEAAIEKFKGILLVVIDGIADYIKDVNDPAQSNAIIKTFEELAIKYRTPIITIVHTNPNSDKERGHLGSQCQRKSESILMVKCEGDVSYLEPKFLRNAGRGNIPLLQFIYNKEKGYHIGFGIKEGEARESREELLDKVTNEIFSGQVGYTWQESIEAIKKATGKGENAAGSIFKDLKKNEVIIQRDDKRWMRNCGKNELPL